VLLTFAARFLKGGHDVIPEFRDQSGSTSYPEATSGGWLPSRYRQLREPHSRRASGVGRQRLGAGWPDFRWRDGTGVSHQRAEV